MNDTRTYGSWSLAVLAILLSPIILIFSIPLMIGIGLDIFDRYGEAPIVLALCAPVALVLLRLVSPRTLLRQFAAALLRPRLPLAPPEQPALRSPLLRRTIPIKFSRITCL
jgi:hypothetical protein